MKLTRVEYAGTPEAWTRLGFTVDRKGEVQLGDVIIGIVSASRGELGLTRLGFERLPAGAPSTLCGVPVFVAAPPPAGPAPAHKNTALSIDHVVMYARDEAAVVDAFKALGVDLRRRVALFEGVTQLFFRPGTIVEVLVNGSAQSDHLWGLTIAVADIDKARASVGPDDASPVRAARQQGRRILTVRHDAVGLRTSMAWMSPHVKQQQPKL